MSTLEDLDDLERENQDSQKQQDKSGKDTEMGDADAKEEDDNVIDLDILRSSTVDIINRRRMLENELKIMKSEFQRLKHEETTMKEKIKDNNDKIENNRYHDVDVQELRCGADFPPKTATISRGKRR